MSEILILAHGMGDSKREDCFAWAAVLYPDGEQYTRETRRWIQMPDGRQIYLLEVYYEDLNELMRAKYEGLWARIDAAHDKAAGINDYFQDVVSKVLSDAAIDVAQSRFVAKYLEAREIARALVGDSADPRSVRIGVLAHSLGTLIAYEGLHRAADVASAFAMHPVNLVVCAPMWTPMRVVQRALGRRRYLVEKGLAKPGRYNKAKERFEPLITKCTGIYDLADPFFRIQKSGAEYEAGAPGNTLIDSFVKVGQEGFNPKKHPMKESYLTTPESRAAILGGLFS